MKESTPGGKTSITPVYRDDLRIVFRCEDLFYPEYKGEFFVLEKSEGYGYFDHMVQTYTKGEIFDEFKILIP